MNAMQFAAALGEISEKSVHEAADFRKPRRLGVKLGAAAACLCLLGGLVWWRMQPGVDSIRSDNGGVMAGGSGFVSDGAVLGSDEEAIRRSIAVYPDTADFSAVTDAALIELNEQEAQSFPILSAYLPAELPEGYFLDYAALYHTTMHNGQEYHMLRVTYAKEGQSQPAEGGGDGQPGAVANADQDSFVLFAMDFCPAEAAQYLDGFHLTADDYVNLAGGATFRISFGEVFLGVSSMGLSPAELETVLTSLPVLHNP